MEYCCSTYVNNLISGDIDIQTSSTSIEVVVTQTSNCNYSNSMKCQQPTYVKEVKESPDPEICDR